MTKRVLIVEDEPSIVTSLEFLMHRCGYETRVVTDGTQVMDQVESFSPDLVLLDVMLPGRSGFEICRHIRSQHGHTRVLMLTAKGGRADVANGMEAGADDYVTKPFSTHDLLDRVRALLEPAAP
ncbi:MAG TPA: response regulator [Usitatibacter sp.]|nr:response regulator [Usitatibacter sp.]